MTTDVVRTFEESLGRLEVEWTHAAADEVPDVLESVCDRPAVGAPLPFDGVELPPWVETDPTPAALREAACGVTAAELAVADYGSLLVGATPDGVEPVSLFGDCHVAVVRADDVVPGMPEAFAWLGEAIRADGDSAVFATGPSATADMGELVKGAHGPKAVRVVILDE